MLALQRLSRSSARTTHHIPRPSATAIRPYTSTPNLQQQQNQSTSKPQPKILADSPPPRAEQSEEVRKHNEAMDQRAERAAEKVTDADVEKDKVGKGFWSGEPGDKSGNKGGGATGGA